MASLTKQQRKEFEAWLKERDHDLGAMITWHRKITKVEDRSIQS